MSNLIDATRVVGRKTGIYETKQMVPEGAPEGYVEDRLKQMAIAQIAATSLLDGRAYFIQQVTQEETGGTDWQQGLKRYVLRTIVALCNHADTEIGEYCVVNLDTPDVALLKLAVQKDGGFETREYSRIRVSGVVIWQRVA